MRRLGRAVGWVAVALAVVGGVRGWMQLGPPILDTRTLGQLRWLSPDLDEKADRMQRLFPEGRVFTLALTGLAWTQLAERDPGLAAEALRQSREALALATDSASRRAFGPAGGLPNGMFYEGWTTRLHVAVVRLTGAVGEGGDPSALVASCARLDAALSAGPVFRDSYPGQAWPADNVVGAAALAGCGDLIDPAFRATASGWLARARTVEDPETGLLPHAARSPGARGSSSALMIPFLAEIDPTYALDQYRRATRTFPTRLLGVLPAMSEYPRGTTGRGDVDSGPLVLGASAPASVVAIAAARRMGDVVTAEALRASTEALGVPITWRGRRRYVLGALPVGDAFLAWASSVPGMGASPTSPFEGWRTRWAVASALLLALGIAGAARLWRTRAYSANSSFATTGR